MLMQKQRIEHLGRKLNSVNKIEFDAVERQRMHEIKLKQMEIERQLQVSRNASKTTLASGM